MTIVFCPETGVFPVMDDDVDYDQLFAGTGITVRAERNSRIDPLAGPGVGFAIVWMQPELIERFGPQTTADEQGCPFRTHAQAVAYERRVLES